MVTPVWGVGLRTGSGVSGWVRRLGSRRPAGSGRFRADAAALPASALGHAMLLAAALAWFFYGLKASLSYAGHRMSPVIHRIEQTAPN